MSPSTLRLRPDMGPGRRERRYGWTLRLNRSSNKRGSLFFSFLFFQVVYHTPFPYVIVSDILVILVVDIVHLVLTYPLVSCGLLVIPSV